MVREVDPRLQLSPEDVHTSQPSTISSSVDLHPIDPTRAMPS